VSGYKNVGRLQSEVERSAAEILGSLDFDEHGEAFPLRIAVFFGLNHSIPDFFVDRPRLVNRGRAVEARDAAFRQNRLTEFRLLKEDGDFGPIVQILVRRPSAAFPKSEMLVVENHRAAAWSDLRKPVGKGRCNQADVNRECRIDVFMKSFRYFGQVASSLKMFRILPIDNSKL
jgi:hypothetical protein